MANYDNGVTLRELDPISKLTGEEQIFVDYEKAYKLTQDTVIVEGKTYYTYDPDTGIYTAVTSPSIESITTYYEAVEAKRYALSRVTLDVQNEIDRIHYYGDKDVIPSDENYFTVNETGETITGLTDTGKTQTELVIPYKINGVEIKLIGDYAFKNNTVVQKIVVPSTISVYGGWAFLGCSSLTEVVVNNNVYLNDYAVFCDCTKLEQINFNKPNCYFYPTLMGAMSGCSSLKHIEIAPDCDDIADNSFLNCTSLTSINVPSSTHIQGGAFSGCTNLTIYCEQGSYADTYAKTNNIPVKYTEVGQNVGLDDELKMGYDSATLIAMYNEANVTPSPEDWFVLHDDTQAVQYLNTEKQSDIEAASELIIPWVIKGVLIRTLGLYAPLQSSGVSIENIKTVRLPNSIKTISPTTFQNFKMESVNIPSSVEEIGSDAFYGCTNLKEVITPIKPNWELNIGVQAFSHCSSLNNIDTIIDGIKTISLRAFWGTAVTNVIIPESVEEIKSEAFGGISTLNCMTFLNKDCVISDTIFGDDSQYYPSLIKGYSGSTAETFATAANIPFMSIEGVELKDLAPRVMVTNLNKTTNKNITKLRKYLDVGGNPQISNQYFTLSDDGRTITGFSSSANGVVTIPYEINDKSVSLADGAFKDATASVKGLIFPDGGGDIPPSLCENMSTLAYLHLPKYSNGTPESIIYIWDNAFKNCTHLIYVEAHSRVSIWDSAFEGCTALETLDLSCGCDYIGANAFKGCTHLKNLILPRDLLDESIDPTAFDGCTNLSICCEEGSVAEAFAIANGIPVRYTEISEGTLASFVTDDVIENRNQYLNFTDSVFPPEESAYTFSDDNTTITGTTTTSNSLTLPYKRNDVDVTTVGASAFKDRTGLYHVVIPQNITTIESEAFSGCTDIYSVRICGDITLKSQAFYGCTKLMDFTCEGNITLGSNAFEGTSLTSIDLTNIAGVAIGANVFKDCTNLKQVIIPSKVKIINAEAFSGCTNLTIYCEPGTKADTFAQSNNIPVVYTKVLKSTLDSKIDKTTITESTDGSITLANNTEFRVADTVTSISLTVPTEVSDDFISSIVFKSGATATTISVTGTAKWCGDNVVDNVFTPVANRVYNIVFYNDGFNIVGVVGGYSS